MGLCYFPVPLSRTGHLRRDADDRIALTVEHRAAAAIAGITLELSQHDDALAPCVRVVAARIE